MARLLFAKYAMDGIMLDSMQMYARITENRGDLTEVVAIASKEMSGTTITLVSDTKTMKVDIGRERTWKGNQASQENETFVRMLTALMYVCAACASAVISYGAYGSIRRRFMNLEDALDMPSHLEKVNGCDQCLGTVCIPCVTISSCVCPKQ